MRLFSFIIVLLGTASFSIVSEATTESKKKSRDELFPPTFMEYNVKRCIELVGNPALCKCVNEVIANELYKLQVHVGELNSLPLEVIEKFEIKLQKECSKYDIISQPSEQV